MTEQRRLAAIVSADVAGYSRLNCDATRSLGRRAAIEGQRPAMAALTASPAPRQVALQPSLRHASHLPALNATTIET